MGDFAGLQKKNLRTYRDQVRVFSLLGRWGFPMLRSYWPEWSLYLIFTPWKVRANWWLVLFDSTGVRAQHTVDGNATLNFPKHSASVISPGYDYCTFSLISGEETHSGELNNTELRTTRVCFQHLALTRSYHHHFSKVRTSLSSLSLALEIERRDPWALIP